MWGDPGRVPPPLVILLTCNSYLNHGLTLLGMLGAMSYAITVTAVGGQLTVEHSGDVPDGDHRISGHEDDSGRSIAVARHSPDGHSLVNASGHHSKER